MCLQSCPLSVALRSATYVFTFLSSKSATTQCHLCAYISVLQVFHNTVPSMCLHFCLLSLPLHSATYVFTFLPPKSGTTQCLFHCAVPPMCRHFCPQNLRLHNASCVSTYLSSKSAVAQCHPRVYAHFSAKLEPAGVVWANEIQLSVCDQYPFSPTI